MDDDALASFTSITDTTPERAQQYLSLTDGNLEQAFELFYANDGADLEGTTSSSNAQQSSQAPTIPPPSTRFPGHGQAYEDDQGVVHIDSESEENLSDDAQVGTSSARNRGQPSSDGRRSIPHAGTTTRSGSGGTADQDELMARRLQEEYYGTAGVGAGEINSDGVRAPIARTTETLVGPDSFDAGDDAEMRAAVLNQMRARRQPTPRHRPGIFNQSTADSIWNESENNEAGHRSRLARATAGASESSSKSNMLAEMYRPPFEIMSRLPWDQARQQGKQGEKWLLVNIQDPSIFDCQVLNRDIWKNAGVMETVKENFIFMQYAKDDPRGSQYIQYYFQGRDSASAYPHIAIVDPRTGEQVKVWSGLPAPKAPEFLMQLHEFLDRYSLKASAKNPVAKRKPEARKETQVDKMTEEQMLEMAMQNSLAPPEPSRRDSDPDILTRSVDHLESIHSKITEGDAVMAEAEAEATPANASKDSAFVAISTSNLHTEPPPDVPSTRIQFRHPNGRVVRRFALSDPVRRIYEWLKASPLEGKEGVEFALTCVGRNLMDHLDSTVEEAGLKNSTVMVEFNES
ncbi:MAG: hypothetical protein Q9191_001078 [Dirinaria sp. TL-2023a]